MKNIKFILLLLSLAAGILIACSDDKETNWSKPTEYDMTGFARGADVSWLTEMEKAGIKFYNTNGQQKECMTLLRDLGMNAIRLRVWVNPAEGWCNKADLLVKAIRAHNLGFRLMIDFHYSDWWADPGQQTKPAAWATLSFDELKAAVANHTRDVLSTLKENNLSPEWVQVGNETGDGMLWDDGRASRDMAAYAALNNAGYDAVKEIFPQAKVIVHRQEGDRNSHFRWLFDGLKANGGKWDVIGMSLYPNKDNWKQLADNCLANMNDMIARYNTEVIIAEIGMPWDQPGECKQLLTHIITQSRAIANNKCLGVFYWEPQSYGGWKGYTLGAFDNNGMPTAAMEAFAKND
ncbi:arabinogalactan endo-1,4-beta-galactosidase [Bacteroides sp. OttesenSCG-928-D19]|nr:arabinogalactan endo-1,4-beta-galactosidase [Bacteroides sp. OttesenSCG-928-D19]